MGDEELIKMMSKKLAELEKVIINLNKVCFASLNEISAYFYRKENTKLADAIRFNMDKIDYKWYNTEVKKYEQR